MHKLTTTSLLSFLLFASCKKTEHEIRTAATINVINTAIDVPGIKVNPSGGPFVYVGNADSVKFGANKFYFSPTNGSVITAVALADTSRRLINMSVNLKSAIYSLYVAGTSTAVDTMFREETNFPFISMNKVFTTADSVVNVRFVNLSPNSVPVKVKIASLSTNEVDNLPYKGFSDWKAYKAGPTATTTYSFQVRDVATDALLTTFSFSATSTNRFKNVSLIIKGLQGTTTGTNAFGIFAVNYF